MKSCLPSLNCLLMNFFSKNLIDYSSFVTINLYYWNEFIGHAVDCRQFLHVLMYKTAMGSGWEDLRISNFSLLPLKYAIISSTLPVPKHKIILKWLLVSILLEIFHEHFCMQKTYRITHSMCNLYTFRHCSNNWFYDCVHVILSQ